MLLIPHRNYGYAAARAYTIYQDPDFLALAATSWTSARQYTISEEQAAAGTMDTKQFTFPSSCQGGACHHRVQLISLRILVHSNSSGRYLFRESCFTSTFH